MIRCLQDAPKRGRALRAARLGVGTVLSCTLQARQGRSENCNAPCHSKNSVGYRPSDDFRAEGDRTARAGTVRAAAEMEGSCIPRRLLVANSNSTVMLSSLHLSSKWHAKGMT